MAPGVPFRGPDGHRVDELAAGIAQIGDVPAVVPDRSAVPGVEQQVTVIQADVLAGPGEDVRGLSPAQEQRVATLGPGEAIDVDVLLGRGVVGQLETGEGYVGPV